MLYGVGKLFYADFSSRIFGWAILQDIFSHKLTVPIIFLALIS